MHIKNIINIRCGDVGVVSSFFAQLGGGWGGGGWVGCMLTQFTFPQHCNAFNCISLQQTAVAQQLLQPFDHFPDNQHCCIASAETGFTVQLDM